MFINVVQKSKLLFKDFPSVDSNEDSKNQAAANPIFSWHVKHIVHKRKKIVIFTNDASTLTIVLYDVNAQNCVLMEQRFQEQLAKLWQSLGMTEKNLNQYLEVAKSWQIGPTVNRNQLGRLNEVSQIIELYVSDGEKNEAFLSQKMTNMLRDSGSSKKATFANDIPQIMEFNNFVWKKAESQTTEIDVEKLRKICNDLKQQEESFRDDLSLEDFDKIVQQMTELNDELINIFVEDVKNEYSEKTIKSYKSSLKFYLNEYLAFRMISIFNREASSVDGLYMYGSSRTRTKLVQRSMAKLYTFLSKYKMVDVAFAKSMKSDMRDSIELLDYLDY
ncbi:DUF6933 domain-containing protein [Companilactobacillus sp. HBUAS56275]|uniref:DUF6933 domain-containing protein n=1 Tax=Candidatus Companilactobacillus pullicola TaxID=2838523 RepID=A0A9D1ZRC6_9LACO|nr:hypothetical protein [Candidatus Companilactobacillus pullicola]